MCKNISNIVNLNIPIMVGNKILSKKEGYDLLHSIEPIYLKEIMNGGYLFFRNKTVFNDNEKIILSNFGMNENYLNDSTFRNINLSDINNILGVVRYMDGLETKEENAAIIKLCKSCFSITYENNKISITKYQNLNKRNEVL